MQMIRNRLFIIAIFCLSVFASAQQDTASAGDSTQMPKCPMMGAAMGAMAPKVVANLQDGSIFVLSGYQLYKYDRDLRLVQQTTIPQDTATMQRMQKKYNEMQPQGRGKSHY